MNKEDAMRNDFESNYLMHHGILGQKWGVRRFQNSDGTLTAEGKARYSKESPRKETPDGNYVYKKGTIAGRFGSNKSFNNKKDITYLYTNEKDRFMYKNKGFGNDELTYKFKKDVKMPKLQKQYEELLEFVKNDKEKSNQYDYAVDEPFEFWKDNVNQGGHFADRYFASMKEKGYDALIDFRNVGMAKDPIIILSPKDSLELVKIGGHNEKRF